MAENGSDGFMPSPLSTKIKTKPEPQLGATNRLGTTQPALALKKWAPAMDGGGEPLSVAVHGTDLEDESSLRAQ